MKGRVLLELISRASQGPGSIGRSKRILSGPDRAVELVGLSWSDLDKPVGLVFRAQLV